MMSSQLFITAWKTENLNPGARNLGTWNLAPRSV